MLLWVGCLCYIPNIPLGVNMPKSVDGRRQTLISSMLSKCATTGSPSYQAAEFTRTVFKRSTQETLVRSNSTTCQIEAYTRGVLKPQQTLTWSIQIIALRETHCNPRMHFPFQVSRQ